MSNKVTYTEIVEALSRKTGFSKQKSELFAKGLIDLVKQDLQESGKSNITNFGSFTVKEVAERQGQNPQTGETITIPAHRRVSFSPYKALREKVNENYSHLQPKLLNEKIAPAESSTVSGSSSEEPPKREQRQGSNMGLIIAALLMLVIVVIASGWFLMKADRDEIASDEAAVETPQTPEAAPDVTGEPESEQQQTNAEPAMDDGRTTDSSENEAVTDPETLNQTRNGTVMTGVIYQVQQDDWYWIIAEKVYENSMFWPLLFMENQARNDDPDLLYPSTGLEVPELEGSVETPSKNDYRRLAEASLVVSKAYLNAGKIDKAQEYARVADKWERQSQ